MNLHSETEVLEALLGDLLGHRLAALLTTPTQQAEAHQVFMLVASTEGGDIWLYRAVVVLAQIP